MLTQLTSSRESLLENLSTGDLAAENEFLMSNLMNKFQINLMILMIANSVPL